MSIKSTETKPMSIAKLEQAKKGLASLSSLHDYSPQRAEYNPRRLTDINTNLGAAFKAENDAKDAYEKARDGHIAAQWAAWDFYQGAAESVIGQYGANSNEYASLGYKKKSEYKKTAPGTKAAKKAAAGTGNSE